MSALFPTYNRWEINIVSGQGSKVVDDKGKEYLDFISGIAVCNLGHRHPHVQNALEEQLNKVWHVSNLFQITNQEETAEIITKQSGLDKVFFCNSGAEANEAAIKAARKYTQRKKIITFKQSFHGRTFATMSATGQTKIQEGFGPLLEEFVYLPYNDEEALEKEMDNSVAAVMLEVVQGEGGVNLGNHSFLVRAEELCRKYGALFIIDEVQTGIGRTGKPFAFQHYYLSPDIVTIAKGLGSGLPVGAMVGKEYLQDAFNPGSHGSTFGGNPLVMAATKATLEVAFQSEFLEEVTSKGEYLTKRLSDTIGKNEWISDIRGKGLMIGIECKGEVAPVLKNLRDKGLLILLAGPKVLRLLPPLTVTKEEIDLAINLMKKEIDQISNVTAQS